MISYLENNQIIAWKEVYCKHTKSKSYWFYFF